LGGERESAKYVCVLLGLQHDLCPLVDHNSLELMDVEFGIQDIAVGIGFGQRVEYVGIELRVLRQRVEYQLFYSPYFVPSEEMESFGQKHNIGLSMEKEAARSRYIALIRVLAQKGHRRLFLILFYEISYSYVVKV